jgi:hypothetical protein
MKNIIEIDITLINRGTVDVLHNDQLLLVVESSGQYTFDVDADHGSNIFLLKPSMPIKVNQLLMFDLGKDKLVYRGLCQDSAHYIFQSQDVLPKSVWSVEYCAPVFAWLHTVLDYGWLVKE